MRAGTENVAGIVGMAVALKNNVAAMKSNQLHVEKLENLLMQKLNQSRISYIRETFHVFMRQSTVFPENYSIGLLWNYRNGKPIMLFRSNGIHGGYENSPHRFVTHIIHRLNLERAAENSFVESDVSETAEYSTFEEAVWFFMSYCGFDVGEMEQHLPLPGRCDLRQS